MEVEVPQIPQKYVEMYVPENFYWPYYLFTLPHHF